MDATLARHQPELMSFVTERYTLEFVSTNLAHVVVPTSI